VGTNLRTKTYLMSLSIRKRRVSTPKRTKASGKGDFFAVGGRSSLSHRRGAERDLIIRTIFSSPANQPCLARRSSNVVPNIFKERNIWGKNYISFLNGYLKRNEDPFLDYNPKRPVHQKKRSSSPTLNGGNQRSTANFLGKGTAGGYYQNDTRRRKSTQKKKERDYED